MTKHSAILMALKRKREEKTKQDSWYNIQTCPFWHLLSLILIIKNTVKTTTFPISVKTILSFLVSFEYLANPFSCKQ